VNPLTRQIASSEERGYGTRVRVSETDPRPDLRGLSGTITQSYGAPDYPAYEVLLDDGRSQLFWHYYLEGTPESAGREVYHFEPGQTLEDDEEVFEAEVGRGGT
jgi:hypothetical protein